MRRSFRPITWFVLLAAVAAALPCNALAAKRVLRLHLDGPVLEAPREGFDLSALFGDHEPSTTYEWLKRIRTAAKDSKIDGIVMIIEQPSLGLAQVEELSQALRDFRSSGKPVYCFMDYAGNASYALASAADHVTLADNSELDLIGLHAQLSFYKGLFEKIGVQADMLHCGDYKTALEPFTRTEPSKENKEMVNWLLDGLYGRLVQLIADNRKLTPEQVKAAIDNAPLDSKAALEHKLIDQVGSFSEFSKVVQKTFGKDVEIVKRYPKDDTLDLDMSNPFAMFQIFQKMMEPSEDTDKPGLGLIYVDGGIVVGKNEPDFLGAGTTAGSTTIRGALETARRDDKIKAVVLRVDSPGGSALASDIIWEAATRLAAEKPLIVSMGNVAGSGGYYVSIPGDTIFAEETTITGSIGVVGGKLVLKGLMEDKLGITTTEFGRGKRAELMSTNRPWNEEERAFMTTMLNRIYTQFKGRVTESRGKRLKGELEPMAGGRVYTGKQALERGLVDRIGGLSDALHCAAEKAGLKGDDYEVHTLPKAPNLADVMKMLSGEDVDDNWKITSTSLSGDPLVQLLAPMLSGARGEPLRRIAVGLRNAVILNREHVGCFMPFDLDLR